MNEDNNQEVTPINEIKVQEQKSTASQTENKPNNNKKTNILLILLFLFFFLIIMGMPEISDYITKLKQERQQAKQNNEITNPEQPTPEPTSNPEPELSKLTCTLTNNSNANYLLIEVQTFSYNTNNQIINSKIDYQYSFSTIDETYHNLKTDCDENALKYATHDGYTAACSYGDNNIEISHAFELETFKTITDDNINIEANATYQQNINTVKENLMNQGYTCE